MTPAPRRTAYDHLVVAAAGELRIRKKHRDDFAQDYAWRVDPALARFDGGRAPELSFAEYVRRVEREALLDDPNRQSFSIATGGGEHVGNVMYYNVSAARDRAELGITIAEPAWQGAGHGTAVTVAFLRYLWANHPFRRVELRTLGWNERAYRCFLRAGFEAVGETGSGEGRVVAMEARREWWLLWDSEGRFERVANR